MQLTTTGPDLKAARLAAGFTLEQLSILLCVTPSAISHWETGRNGINKVNHWRLNGVLDLDPTQDKEEEAPPAQEANADTGTVTQRWMKELKWGEASALQPRLAGPRISMVIEVDDETREALEQLAEDQYRTPAAQVAWIVKQYLAGRGGEG